MNSQNFFVNSHLLKFVEILEKDADNIRKYFVNHSFSGMENYIGLLIITEWTILIHSA